MESIIASTVAANFAMEVLAVLVLVFLFVVLVGPKIKAFFNKNDDQIRELKETDKCQSARIEQLEVFKFETEAWKKALDQRQAGYARHFEQLDSDVSKAKSQSSENLQELEIIMRATSAILRGIKDLGSTSLTGECQKEIDDFLTKKAHRREE